MLISDMLITDYSSVIFEYALLGKPIAFFCYDLLRYDRDFYLKYPDDLPGDVDEKHRYHAKEQTEQSQYLHGTRQIQPFPEVGNLCDIFRIMCLLVLFF